MEFEVFTYPELTLSGQSVVLSTSQSENAKRISSLWKSFNRELQIRNLKGGYDWVKYGVTQKISGDYIYTCAVPAERKVDDFESITLCSAPYARFQHRGSLSHLKATFFTLYKKVLPESGLIIDPDRPMLHFEKYDHRFHWTRSDSIIEICIPILKQGDS